MTRSVEDLGYDPRPAESHWYRTPIPRVYKPLPATPEFLEIARKRWWNGDPWTVLHNRDAFMKRVMGYATHEEFLHVWENVPREDWIAMLKRVRPGEVPRRAYRLCMYMAGLLGFGASPGDEWRQNRHRNDMRDAYLERLANSSRMTC